MKNAVEVDLIRDPETGDLKVVKTIHWKILIVNCLIFAAIGSIGGVIVGLFIAFNH